MFESHTKVVEFLKATTLHEDYDGDDGDSSVSSLSVEEESCGTVPCLHSKWQQLTSDERKSMLRQTHRHAERILRKQGVWSGVEEVLERHFTLASQLGNIPRSKITTGIPTEISCTKRPTSAVSKMATVPNPQDSEHVLMDNDVGLSIDDEQDLHHQDHHFNLAACFKPRPLPITLPRQICYTETDLLQKASLSLLEGFPGTLFPPGRPTIQSPQDVLEIANKFPPCAAATQKEGNKFGTTLSRSG